MVTWSLAIVFAAAQIIAQGVPPPDDSRHSMLREVALGILPSSTAAISASRARQQCLKLPVGPANDRLAGPHGDILLSTRCEIFSYQSVGEWTIARYRWTSQFTPEDASGGARDTIIEEEEVLLRESVVRQVQPVWHERFETGAYAVWRSVTPEITEATQGTTLLSVMHCLNGTGGCGQEFLARHSGGRWAAVKQDWLDQLPPGFAGRIRHGARIDPKTLGGEAGFYNDRDPNCCPSERLVFRLALRGDALVLIQQSVLPMPQQ